MKRADCKGYPSDVSDEEWNFAAPYLTLMDVSAPQRKYELRDMFDGLRWMARAGARWRYAPMSPHTVQGGEIIPVQHSTSTRNVDGGRQTMVYVVDDDEAIRLALGDLFLSTGLGVETFGSSQEFLAFAKWDVPSCLILDVRLRGESGLTFQEEIRKSGLQMPVLFMTGHGDIEMSVKAMKAGAIDFFSKPFRDQDMLDAVSNALRRDAERIAAERSTAVLRACYESLTPREREIVRFVVAGIPNKQIASQINLSEITVKVHRRRAMGKMVARSVADLVRKAEALGIEPHYTK
jgi:RNA polymerase sigma factor (sigma-70 family)